VALEDFLVVQEMLDAVLFLRATRTLTRWTHTLATIHRQST